MPGQAVIKRDVERGFWGWISSARGKGIFDGGGKRAVVTGVGRYRFSGVASTANPAGRALCPESEAIDDSYQFAMRCQSALCSGRLGPAARPRHYLEEWKKDWLEKANTLLGVL